MRKYPVIPAFLSFGAALYNTLLPLAIVKLGGDVLEYALVNIVYCVFYAIGSWFLPSVLMGLHRRKILSICCALLFLSSLMTSALLNTLVITLIQVPYALFIALATVVQTNIFIELWRGGKGVTLLYVASSVGWIASLVIGSLMRLITASYFILFMISSLGFLIASLTSLTLPSTVGVIESQKVISFKALYRWVIERIRVFNPLALPKPVFRIRRFASLKLFLLGTCLTYLAIGLYFTVLPIYLKRVIRISDTEFIALSATAGTASLILYLMQLSISENISYLWKAHISSLITRSVLFILPIWLSKSVNYFILYSLLGVTWSFIGSVQNIIASKLAPPRRKDEVIGDMNALVSIGLMMGFIISFTTNHLGYRQEFIISTITILTSAIINYKAYKLYESGLV